MKSLPPKKGKRQLKKKGNRKRGSTRPTKTRRSALKQAKARKRTPFYMDPDV